MKKFENIVNNSFDNFATKFQKNSEYCKSVPLNVESRKLEKEKHMIGINGKGDDDQRFNQKSWSTVVKSTVSSELKNIPIEKSLLSKEGNGCLFFPNKDSQMKAQDILQPYFKVEAVTKTRKPIMPKIKVYDVDSELYQEKSNLKQAILDKNPEINALVSNGSTLEIIIINEFRNDAILKVSPDIRQIMIKSGRIFLGLLSCKIRDHFQPLQCYACQEHGHKHGSEECKFHNTDKCICFYCAGDHLSKDCLDKRNRSKHTCANCKHSDNNGYKANAGHTATSLKCPFVIKEINSLVKRTSGLNVDESKKFLIPMP